MSTRLALATSADFPNLHDDDRVVLPALRERGFEPEAVQWDADVDWSRYDRIVIRSIWDYFRRFDEFGAWLDRLDQMGAPVLNPVRTLRWNSDKRYLRQLTERGLPTVETVWISRGERLDLPALFAVRGWQEAVVKPSVSGGGWRTFRVRRDQAESAQAEVDALAQQGDVMVQPFVREILDEGERSLVYFNRFFSHAMQKRPKAGEFLVQLEHGGTIERFEPAGDLRDLAERALGEIEGPLLYGRVDVVRFQGRWAIGEVEVVEPMLYFRFAPDAAARFASALATL